MKNNFFLRLVSFVLCIAVIFSVSCLSVYAYEEESEAESEAEPEQPEIILGDADSNGKVTAADARLILRATAGLVKLWDINYMAADFDENGKITAADARYVLRFAVGLSPFYVPPAKPELVKSKLIKITPVCQYPDYPAGCESVAAVMNLNYLGYGITTEKFIDSFLPIGVAPYKVENTWYSSDPNQSFMGDPRSEKGWGIWAKGLTTAINRYLDTQVRHASGSYTYSETLDSLCEKYILNDIPVLVWVTAEMKAPYANISPIIIGTNKTFTWISPNHCMLLVGFDETGYYFNDPITGKLEKYSKEASKAAFTGNGSQAVIIEIE